MQFFTLSTATLLIALLLASPAYAQQTDYKQFGQSAIEELGVDPHADLSDAELVEHIKEKHGTLGKLAAGALFFLSPVKKVKLLSLLGLTALGTVACGGDNTGGVTRPEVEPDPPATPCTRNETGYFQITGGECIKFPKVSFSFNESSNAVLPAGDEATIKIEFDSEIVFVNGSQWSELGEEEVLEMVEVSHEFWDGVTIQDYKRRITIDNSNQKTVISLEAPGEVLATGAKEYGWYSFGNWTITVGNYAKKADAQKIIQSDNFANYLELTEVETDFVVSTSCNSNLTGAAPEEDMATAPAASTVLPDMEKTIIEKLNALETQQVVFNKADPNTTYYIDIAFVVSEDMLREGTLHRWDSYLKQRYFPRVNQIFQNSGVNVEFRVKAVRPFSEYKGHLACSANVPSIDFLSIDSQLSLLTELVPKIRADHEVDLVYGILRFSVDSPFTGVAMPRIKDLTVSAAARFSSVTILTDNEPNKLILHLASSLGRNLGLSYDKNSLSEYPDPNNFTGYGYGYRGPIVDTIMAGSYFKTDIVPMFSSNQTLTKYEICRNDVFFDDMPPFGMCNNYPYVNDSDRLRVGDAEANSSEALQWTIEGASNYSNY